MLSHKLALVLKTLVLKTLALSHKLSLALKTLVLKTLVLKTLVLNSLVLSHKLALALNSLVLNSLALKTLVLSHKLALVMSALAQSVVKLSDSEWRCDMVRRARFGVRCRMGVEQKQNCSQMHLQATSCTYLRIASASRKAKIPQ